MNAHLKHPLTSKYRPFTTTFILAGSFTLLLSIVLLSTAFYYAYKAMLFLNQETSSLSQQSRHLLACSNSAQLRCSHGTSSRIKNFLILKIMHLPIKICLLMQYNIWKVVKGTQSKPQVKQIYPPCQHQTNRHHHWSQANKQLYSSP